MPSLKRALWGTAMAAALAACSTFPSTGPVRLSPDHPSWDEVVRETTRRTQPYVQTTIRAADLRATLVTPRLRKAFIDHRGEFQGEFADDLSKDLIDLGDVDEGVNRPMKARPDAEQQVLVFVAMYVADRADRDLAGHTSIWDVELRRGAFSEKPSSIETLRMSPAAVEVFPYIDRFDDLYLMRFPLVDLQGHSFLAPGGEPLRLEVKSALADAVVEWTLAQ